jgi:4-hydroxyphenylpyruvate dioxygenase
MTGEDVLTGAQQTGHGPAERVESLGVVGPTAVTEIDHVEIYVSNPRQAAHFYRTTFGLPPVAYAGPETGTRKQISLALEHQRIKLVLTASTEPGGAIDEHILMHGEGVRDISFRVDDAEAAFASAVSRGARPVQEPTLTEDECGYAVKATVAACDGDTVHSLVQRGEYGGAFLPSYSALRRHLPAAAAGLTSIDHVAICVEEGQLDRWVEFYRNVFGFRLSHQEDVTTEYSGMNSKVMQNGTGQVKLVMMEPVSGRRKSQIQEYLSAHCGPGTQHVALAAESIIDAVRTVEANGVEFLSTPGAYYDVLSDRVGAIDETLALLREFNILVDREDGGYLMQVFTKPVLSRSTLFWEIIQRKGASGFGGGNIRALFQAIEREHARRGSL